jgi:isopenicillin N synthase-like dioxygenase
MFFICQKLRIAFHCYTVPCISPAHLKNLEQFNCHNSQVLNHGVPEEVMVSIKRDIQEFFELPLDVKNAYAQTPGDLQGYGQAYVFSNDQKLDWSDMLGIISQPPPARDMKHWPTQPLTFRLPSDMDVC